ncbi:LEM-3-like GIY-YIG domain-containing protein [Aquihabitans daechungensis]|uniref:LEM-3-like GIY-YIG domain-containing protein n=1 Tax=Aquihabitans daechungensis TaxID=1052257 RepID=UPI003B9E0844
MEDKGGRASANYYVYLLLKTPLSSGEPLSRFDLANVLYVGKGKAYRWRQHFKEAASTAGPKSKAIISALGPDPSPETIERHALIVAGHLTEPEAFRLESIMMHLVGGLSAVTNLVAGHAAHELMVPAFDARVFFGAEDLEVDVWNVRGKGPRQSALKGGSPPGKVVFIVKGTDKSLEESHWSRGDKAGRFKGSTTMVKSDDAPNVRRGWDPHTPWTPAEAASRARRFWAGSVASVSLWQELIEDRGGYLALVVPDPRDARSVVRYVWTLDPKGEWEDYGQRFGFPIGSPVLEHPWLGKRLVDRATGRGVLKSQSAPAVTLWQPEAPDVTDGTLVAADA